MNQPNQNMPGGLTGNGGVLNNSPANSVPQTGLFGPNTAGSPTNNLFNQSLNISPISALNNSANSPNSSFSSPKGSSPGNQGMLFGNAGQPNAGKTGGIMFGNTGMNNPTNPFNRPGNAPGNANNPIDLDSSNQNISQPTPATTPFGGNQPPATNTGQNMFNSNQPSATQGANILAQNTQPPQNQNTNIFAAMSNTGANNTAANSNPLTAGTQPTPATSSGPNMFAGNQATNPLVSNTNTATSGTNMFARNQSSTNPLTSNQPKTNPLLSNQPTTNPLLSNQPQTNPLIPNQIPTIPTNPTNPTNPLMPNANTASTVPNTFGSNPPPTSINMMSNQNTNQNTNMFNKSPTTNPLIPNPLMPNQNTGSGPTMFGTNPSTTTNPTNPLMPNANTTSTGPNMFGGTLSATSNPSLSTAANPVVPQPVQGANLFGGNATLTNPPITIPAATNTFNTNNQTAQLTSTGGVISTGNSGGQMGAVTQPNDDLQAEFDKSNQTVAEFIDDYRKTFLDAYKDMQVLTDSALKTLDERQQNTKIVNNFNNLEPIVLSKSYYGIIQLDKIERQQDTIEVAIAMMQKKLGDVTYKHQTSRYLEEYYIMKEEVLKLTEDYNEVENDPTNQQLSNIFENLNQIEVQVKEMDEQVNRYLTSLNKYG